MGGGTAIWEGRNNSYNREFNRSNGFGQFVACRRPVPQIAGEKGSELSRRAFLLLSTASPFHVKRVDEWWEWLIRVASKLRKYDFQPSFY